MLWTILDPPQNRLSDRQKERLYNRWRKRRRINAIRQARKYNKPVGRALRNLELKIRQENRW